MYTICTTTLKGMVGLRTMTVVESNAIHSPPKPWPTPEPEPGPPVDAEVVVVKPGPAPRRGPLGPPLLVPVPVALPEGMRGMAGMMGVPGGTEPPAES